MNRIKPVPSDLDIAQGAEIRPIKEIAAAIGLREADIEYYGSKKAKVHLNVRERLGDTPNGKYVVVTALLSS